MTTLDPKTIAADLMTSAARDLDRLDVLTHIGQAYEVLSYDESLANEVLDLVKVAGIDLLWPDGTRDTELDAQRVENERIRAHRDDLRARIDAAHDALSRLDGVDEDSTATLETTVRYLADRWQHLCDAEAKAAAEVDRLGMFEKRYFEVQELLDEVLGPDEEDRTGEGIVQEVHLVAQQRDDARAEEDRLRAELVAVERYADQLRADAAMETNDAVAVGLLRAADGLGDLPAEAVAR